MRAYGHNSPTHFLMEKRTITKVKEKYLNFTINCNIYLTNFWPNLALLSDLKKAQVGRKLFKQISQLIIYGAIYSNIFCYFDDDRSSQHFH
jgi:hypothetical protein